MFLLALPFRRLRTWRERNYLISLDSYDSRNSFPFRYWCQQERHSSRCIRFRATGHANIPLERSYSVPTCLKLLILNSRNTEPHRLITPNLAIYPQYAPWDSNFRTNSHHLWSGCIQYGIPNTPWCWPPIEIKLKIGGSGQRWATARLKAGKFS